MTDPDDSLSIQELAELVGLDFEPPDDAMIWEENQVAEDAHLEAAYEDRFGFTDDDGYND